MGAGCLIPGRGPGGLRGRARAAPRGGTGRMGLAREAVGAADRTEAGAPRT